MSDASTWFSSLPSMQTLAPYFIQGLALVSIMLGIILWLMGKRLARPACTGVWILVGMLAAAGVCHLTGDRGLLPLWLVIGGVIGGVLGWVVYRLCLAMALCVILGLTAPAVAHFIQGSGQRPDLADDTQALVESVRDEARQTRDELKEDQNALTASGVLEKISRIAKGPWDKLQAYWQELPESSRTTIISAAGIGAIIGLVLGLIFPSLGAATGSSLLGSLFMAGGCIAFFAQYNPSLLEALDDRMAACLVTLGLITAMGVGIQWTLQRRRTDN